MTKNGLRGFGTGIFVACAVIAIYYYMFSHLNSTALGHQTNTANGLTQTRVDQYLANKGQIAVDQATFNEWQSDQQNSAPAKSSAPTKSTGSTQKNQTTSPAKPTVTKMVLTIKSGMSVSDIAKTLEQNKVIKDQQAFYNFMVKNKLDTKIQLGTFNVSSNMTTAQIAKAITK